jgi:hypothetical protein
MKAVEFKSKIKNNQISIPLKIQSELKSNKDQNVRVIVLVEDVDMKDDVIFQKSAQNHFLNGYAESDSVYDNY